MAKGKIDEVKEDNISDDAFCGKPENLHNKLIAPNYRDADKIYNEMIDYVYNDKEFQFYGLALGPIIKVILKAIAIQLSKTKQV